MPIRVGVIGCGFISKMHFEGYKKCPQVQVAGFCDIIPERAEKARDTYGDKGSRIYTDYKEMIAAENLDAVSVCTENRMHAEITIYALDHGLHVFCEKPMAISGKQADQMVEAARRNGKKLTVGYQMRFMEDEMLLRREVEAGTFGPVYYAEATTLRRRGVPTWGVFLDAESQGGGPLIDIGTHALDL
ncbi:MAG: Gfo/Idh/MocA family oxidoreductase, partial [Clostridiales bacterium]|nr:Gfo/Idh/MocA family oxidoreductase [Clostridiales bacterium]